jgi:glycosyltransferase involved in cell wall biosynthesis
MAKGINLIGYATSPTGLGEDLRSFAAMLDFLNISYSIIDVPTESQGRVKYPWQHLTTETFSSSFFFMSPMECMRLKEAQPKLFSEPKLKVGYFLWELPDYPDRYLKALDVVDHIWCPTQFVQEAFFKKMQKLILVIPLPVINVKRKGRQFRRELEIPNEAFVTLYMFDIRSTLARKNPQATIEAFLEFAKELPNAYLILKINRWEQVDRKQFDWMPLHPRIRILNEHMNDSELADLYEASDVYLSLHRSEGFGRTLVEAMQHGLEVVSTNYSGPHDFLTEDNARLVEWKETPANPGDYPYTLGSRWAEPSIKSAVMRLNEAYTQRSPKRKRMIQEAGNLFSIDKLAMKYRSILKTYTD